MHTSPRQRTLLLLALFSLALVLTTGAVVSAQQIPEEATTTDANPPVNALFTWSLWSAKTPESTFDLARCNNIQVGDANGDALDDLVCAYNYGGATTRTFVQYSQTNHLTGWTNQHSTLIDQFELNLCRPLLSGDVNDDGRLDLICPYDYGTNTRTFVQLATDDGYTNWLNWTGNGNSGFDLERCESILSGDINGAGYDDLACVYNYGGATTRTFVQLSSGSSYTLWTNQHPTLIDQFETANCRPLLSGDVNGDGRMDLICPYDYGLQTRTFVQLATVTGYTNWLNWSGDLNNNYELEACAGIEVGDIDGNGYDDLACAYNYGGASTRTFVQLSDGSSLTGWTNQHPTLIEQFELSWCRPLTSGDINEDGRMDLICPYDYGLNTRTWVQLATDTGYTNWLNWTGNGNSQFDMDRCTVRTAELDGDGITDLVCAYDYPNASTATFVQRARIYRLGLPSILR